MLYQCHNCSTTATMTISIYLLLLHQLQALFHGSGSCQKQWTVLHRTERASASRCLVAPKMICQSQRVELVYKKEGVVAIAMLLGIARVPSTSTDSTIHTAVSILLYVNFNFKSAEQVDTYLCALYVGQVSSAPPVTGESNGLLLQTQQGIILYICVATATVLCNRLAKPIFGCMAQCLYCDPTHILSY